MEYNRLVATGESKTVHAFLLVLATCISNGDCFFAVDKLQDLDVP